MKLSRTKKICTYQRAGWQKKKQNKYRAFNTYSMGSTTPTPPKKLRHYKVNSLAQVS